MECLGEFGLMPRDLRVWFFSRLHPCSLAKLRVNNTLKTFIDMDVRRYILNELLSLNPDAPTFPREFAVITLQERNKWTIKCIVCGINCKVNGGFRIRPDIFGRNVIVREKDGGRIVTVITQCLSPKTMGWCYRCFLVNGNDPFKKYHMTLDNTVNGNDPFKKYHMTLDNTVK
jgi:hypothetical protein